MFIWFELTLMVINSEFLDFRSIFDDFRWFLMVNVGWFFLFLFDCRRIEWDIWTCCELTLTDDVGLMITNWISASAGGWFRPASISVASLLTQLRNLTAADSFVLAMQHKCGPSHHFLFTPENQSMLPFLLQTNFSSIFPIFFRKINPNFWCNYPINIRSSPGRISVSSLLFFCFFSF